ncbi:glycosyltransferase family 39 protein [bacterium]|nr:glycosyltransferase family 39 protein [bacterium]
MKIKTGKDKFSMKQHIGTCLPEHFWRVVAGFYAIVLFFLNFIRIFDNNFWLDEAFSINLAKMDFAGMISATAADVHPPLYYAILMLMYHLLGDHGWVFHLTSIIPYAITIVFVFSVIWKRFGKGTVFLMITFISIMRSAVVYNVEVRMYSWAALFVLMAYYACYMILADDRRSGYILFAVFALLAAYTHYYTIIPLVILTVSVFVFLLVKKRKVWQFMAALYVSTILYLPWMSTVIRQFQRTSDSFLRDDPGLAKGLCYFFWQGNGASSGSMLGFNVLYSGILLLFATCLVFWLMWSGIKKLPKNSNSEVVDFTEAYWIFSGYTASIGTLLALELISILFTPTLTYKYLHPVVGLMWLAFSVAVSKLKNGNLIAGILTIVTLLISLPMYIETYKTEVEADKQCMATHQMMIEMISKDDVMLTNNEHLAWAVLQYYWPNMAHKYISDLSEIGKLESDKQYWILWSDSLGKTLINIEDLNYQVAEKCRNCELGSTSFHLYQLVK